MFKKIDHIEMIPSDRGRSVAFYTSVLGLLIFSSYRNILAGAILE